MPTLRNLKYQDDQVITDRSGHEVDLSNLERNFSPTYDADTGEYATNPKLQRYIDFPWLADLEADLAAVQSRPGQYTAPGESDEPPPENLYERSGDYEGKTKIETRPNPKRQHYDRKEGLEGQRASEASQRIEQFNRGQPPYAQQGAVQPYRQAQPVVPRRPEDYDGSMQERQQFKKMIVETMFGGKDPLTFDPMEQLDQMTFSDYQAIYEQRFSEAGGQMPLWWDLDDSQKQSFIKSQRAFELQKFQSAHTAILNAYKDVLGDYEHQVALNEKEKERQRASMTNAAKFYRQGTKEIKEAHNKNLDRIVELADKIGELDQKIWENQAFPERVKPLKETRAMIEKEVKRLKQQNTQGARRGAAVKSDALNVTPGSRARGKLTREAAQLFFEAAGGDRLIAQGVGNLDPRMIEAMERAAQMAEDAGWDTSPMREDLEPPNPIKPQRSSGWAATKE